MTEDLLWQNCGFRWRDNKIPGHLRRKGLHMCTRPSSVVVVVTAPPAPLTQTWIQHFAQGPTARLIRCKPQT